MVQITLVDVAWQIENGPNNVKVLEFKDKQSGMVVAIPLDAPNAKTIGNALASSVLVATQPLPRNGNGHPPI